MPIHLAPISRRQFLARSLAATAGVALAHELFAQAPGSAPDSWALFSDIHLAGDRSTVERGVNMADHFSAVSLQLLALPKAPAGLFINGDCAFSSGEAADYSTLAESLKPLRLGQVPIHLGLGNHDNREHFWDAFRTEAAATRPLADRQASMVASDKVNWFVLDSLEKTSSTPGLLGREQLDWLGKSLDANAHKPALVLVHHNPGLSGGNMGLKDTMLLLEILRPRRQVKAYIFGHTHHWGVEQDDSGMYLINLPAVAYVFQPGEPSGWVHASMRTNGMKLKLCCVDPAHPAHGQLTELTWRT